MVITTVVVWYYVIPVVYNYWVSLENYEIYNFLRETVLFYFRDNCTVKS